MRSARKPRWQQVTALVSLGAGGAVTGLSFVPKSPADLTSPASLPIRLMALEQAAKPPSAPDAVLRSAIVNVSRYYLRLAEHRTPAEMEALIWQHDSRDGADHGPSCAAFASLALEIGAQAVGQHSWVTGGSSYPWPLHTWADARVDPNPASPGIVSIQQDAQAHGRWHPLGDGYTPRPGDWVLFGGHVEVVTGYSGGTLSTIGGDSMPNFSVNAHSYRAPLAAQGVAGFVNNGNLTGPARQRPPGPASGPGGSAVPGTAAEVTPAAATPAGVAPAEVTAAEVPGPAADIPQAGPVALAGADRGAGGKPPAVAAAGGASIPGTAAFAVSAAARPADHYRRHHTPVPPGPLPDSGAQRAFIEQVAPGAIATQRTYGVPASVTIAQAIEESGWGRSRLATRDHNLFGIKGTGPAGSDSQPTLEFSGGQWVSTSASFRVYHSVSQSISDHGRLLAGSAYYQKAMAVRRDPDAFAAALTGVYATDPQYGAKLIALMRAYDLYRYDDAAARGRAAAPVAAAIPGTMQPAPSKAPPSKAPPSKAPAAPPASSRPAIAAATPSQAGIAASAPSRAGVTASAPSQRRLTPSAPSQPGIAAFARSQPAVTAAPPSKRTAAPLGPAAAAAGRSNGPAAWAPASPASAGRQAGQARRPASAAGQAPPAVPAPPRPRAAARASAPARSQAPAGARSGAAARPTPAAGRPGAPSRAGRGAPSIPGPLQPFAAAAVRMPAPHPSAPAAQAPRRTQTAAPRRYQPQIPPAVKSDFAAMARGPLERSTPLYQDVAARTGIPWQVLAACDWMQCGARARYSPVHGERLGTVNLDGTVYPTRSAALEQCAEDLIRLADAVYRTNLTGPGHLSVTELANAFAAFRWGGLLRAHRTSAMEFPYSVAGLTMHHTRMRWPSIADPRAPDRPGGRFRMPFGAVPAVLLLNYPATV